jgi:hypothetical protein
MDPDPAIFVIDLQNASKKLIFYTIFSAYYFLKVHLHHISKIKSQKESQSMWIRRIRIRNTACPDKKNPHLIVYGSARLSRPGVRSEV